MAQKIAKDELEKLIQIVGRHPEGVSVEKVLVLLGSLIPKRTLQYRLAHLVKSGILQNLGVGRSSKYSLRNGAERGKTPLGNSQVSFSLQAQEVQELIAAPIQMRAHVSYHPEFLYSYEPNKTHYLTQPVLEKLFRLGAKEGRGDSLKKVYERFLIDLAWNSSRLYGNTYSLKQTEELLRAGHEPPGKNRVDTRTILNHKEAVEFIFEGGEGIGINRYTFLNTHALLSKDLLFDQNLGGRLRTIPIYMANSVYHPVEVPQLIERYFQFIIDKGAAIHNPFEQSFFLLVHLSYLQPFIDMNSRVSRLICNIPFIQKNLSLLSFVDVAEADYNQALTAIYELNRIELFRDIFVWAYERSAAMESALELDDSQEDNQYLIKRAVCEIVRSKMNRIKVFQFVHKFARDNIPFAFRSRFIEMLENEINNIHEGNLARFRIQPSEFLEWKKTWV